MYQYKATVDRVVDGDTIDLIIDLGFRITTHQRIRLEDIDTPEVRGEEREDGLVSKAFVEEHMPVDSDVMVATSKTGKYGRWLGKVYTVSDDIVSDKSIGDMLLEAKLAVPYGDKWVIKEGEI